MKTVTLPLILEQKPSAMCPWVYTVHNSPVCVYLVDKTGQYEYPATFNLMVECPTDQNPTEQLAADAISAALPEGFEVRRVLVGEFKPEEHYSNPIDWSEKDMEAYIYHRTVTHDPSIGCDVVETRYMWRSPNFLLFPGMVKDGLGPWRPRITKVIDSEGGTISFRTYYERVDWQTKVALHSKAVAV